MAGSNFNLKYFTIASKDVTIGSKDFTVGSKGLAIGSKSFTVGSKDLTIGSKDFAADSKVDSAKFKSHLITILQKSTAMPFRRHENQYKCFYCASVFLLPSKLKEHTTHEHKYMDFHESLRIWTEFDLDNNLMVDIQDLSCRVCNSNMADMDYLKMHFFERHKEIVPKDVKTNIICFKLSDAAMNCFLCKEDFDIFDELVRHMKAHPHLACQVCKETFSSDKGLKEHEKSYCKPCGLCDMRLQSTKQRDTHLNVVHGIGIQCDFHGSKDFAISSKDLTIGSKSFTVGSKDLTIGSKDFTAGSKDLAIGSKSFTVASKDLTIVTKDLTIGSKSFTVGSKDLTIGLKAFAVGSKDLVIGSKSFTVGSKDLTIGSKDFAISSKDLTIGSKSFTVGSKDLTIGSKDFTVGSKDLTIGSKSFAVGSKDLTIGSKAFAADSKDFTVDSKVDSAKFKSHLITILQKSTAMPFRRHENQYKCFYCASVFLLPSKLKEHTTQDHKYMDFHESLRIWTEFDLSDTNLMVDIQDLSCRVCNSNMADMNYLKMHFFERHKVIVPKDVMTNIICFKLSDDALNCFLCKEDFNIFEELVRHIKAHPYLACQVCKETFSSDKGFEEHEKSYCKPCGLCDMRFQSTKQRDAHLNVVHGIGMQCDFCPRQFSTRVNLVRHIRNVHYKEKNGTCDVCGKTFFDTRLLNLHKVSHDKIKKFECDVCKKMFTRIESMKLHKRIHSNDRRYSCQICGKTFIQWASLSMHKVAHTDERNFKCPVCNKGFKDKHSLGKHYKCVHRKDDIKTS